MSTAASLATRARTPELRASRLRSLSHQQEAVWLLAQFLPPQQQCALNLCYEFELYGSLDAEAMTKAVNALADVHPALRTCIWIDDGHVRQGLPLEMPPLKIDDVRDRPDPLAAAAALAHAEAERIVDLATGPLATFRLIRAGDDRYCLVMNVHHVIADGTSIPILRASLAALYTSCVTGRPAALASAGVGSEALVAAQAAREASGALAEHERYWLQELTPAVPPLELPRWRDRPPARSFRAEWLTASLSRRLVEACERRSFRLHSPVSAFYLAAFAWLLAGITGRRDMVIGTGFTGRRPGDPWQHAVGLFANTVPVVLRLDRTGTPAATVRQVASQYIGAYDHQDYPLQRLLALLTPPRTPDCPVPFQVGYNYQSLPATAVQWAGLTEARFDRVYSATSAFDFVLDVSHDSDKTDARFVYATDVLPRDFVIEAAERYVRLLEELADCPNSGCVTLRSLS